MNRIAVREEIKPIVLKHVPRNCRRFNYNYCDNSLVDNTLGAKKDFPTFEGRVVEISELAIYVRVKRNLFYLVDPALVTAVPRVGDKVRVTPYARRHFDGTRIDEPKIETRTMLDGTEYQVKTMVIGNVTTELPVSHEAHACYELTAMIDQLETLRAPDGFRSISQMLYDVGATDFAIVDPVPVNIIKTPPTVRFSVANRKHSGQVEIIYDRGPDTYRIELIHDGNVIESVRDVYFDDLGAVLHRCIDDGSWNKIDVDILSVGKSRVRH